MSTNSTAGTVVPQNQQTAHANIVTKIAFGQRDIPLMLLTKDMTTTKALETVEYIIVGEVECNHWRNIVSGDNSRGAPCDLFRIWTLAVDDIFGNNSNAKATRLFDLVDKMVAAIEADHSITYYQFDEETTKSICCTLLGWITSCHVEADVKILWERFLTLDDKRNKFGNKLVFNSKLISEQLKEASRFIGKDIAAMLIKLTPSKMIMSAHQLGSIAINQLWIQMTSDDASSQTRWSRIMYPLIELQGNANAIEACTQSVTEICKFTQALSALPRYLPTERIYISGEPTIKADYKTCTVEEIIVRINTAHFEFCTSEISKQQKLVGEYSKKILNDVSKWASQKGIKTSFKLTILGYYSPQTPQRPSSPHEQDFDLHFEVCPSLTNG